MRRIGVITDGDSLDDEVGSCFGRSHVVIVEWDNGIKKYEAVQVLQSEQCVGPNLAEDLASNYRVEAVITGTIGCGAYGVLEKKGVDVYETVQGKTVEEVVIEYFSNNLDEIEESNSPGGTRCGGACGGCKH